ncbi:MAG TPA: hypothetical protein PKE51_10630 [Gemmatimonadaceae bacterium]|nr:hypothetical protein [Gemmatimonadaceae bacterium]
MRHAVTRHHHARHTARIALLVALIGCEGRARDTDPIVVRDSSGVAIVANDLTRLDATCTVDPTPAVSIGVDAGQDEDVLHRVFGATRLTDGTIVVVNGGTQELRFFGADGRFLRAAGREGRGPGEFADAFYIHWLPGDTLYVGDYRPFQFLVFGPDGTWVRTVRPTPLYPNSPATMHVLRDGRLMLGEQDAFERVQPAAFRERTMTVVLHASDGTLTDTVAQLPNGRWGQTEVGQRYPWIYPLFESFAVSAARDDRIVLGHASETELRVHRATDGLPLDRIIRWTVGDRTVRPEDISAERARLGAQYPDLAPEQRAVLVDPLLSEQRPVADRFPAFGRLRLARDGRLWVRAYPRPQDPPEHRWLAFGADGRFACTLVTPRYDDVLEFGADYLLTHERDSLGVERVRQYPLSTPAR